MGKIVGLLICILIVLSCKKDKTPEPCTGISMVGERERFVGKWKWYKTIVQEWFDVGTPIYHDYTPVTEGFDYYFTISSDGLYKGYRNDTLIHDFMMTGEPEEIFNGYPVDVFKAKLDCAEEELEFIHWVWNDQEDTIYQLKYPLNFRDEELQLESKNNYFVRE
jgi:hypothetical protein